MKGFEMTLKVEDCSHDEYVEIQDFLRDWENDHNEAYDDDYEDVCFGAREVEDPRPSDWPETPPPAINFFDWLQAQDWPTVEPYVPPRPRNHGNPWTDELDKALIHLVVNVYETVEEIAEDMGRTEVAIEMRLNRVFGSFNWRALL
jgi:hypothetical protein